MTTAQEPMNRKDYEDALGRLEVELCALQLYRCPPTR